MTARDRFLQVIAAQVGQPYRWGAAGPDAFDCSGLLWWGYNQAIAPPLPAEYRDSHRWDDVGRVVSGSLRPGDVLLWDTTNGHEVRLGNRISHVSVYVGDGQMVSALNQTAGVVRGPVDTGYWRERRLGARRLFDDAGEVLGLAGAIPAADAAPASPHSREPRDKPPREREPRARTRVRQRLVDAWRRRRRR